jgi:hypothetical protein
MPLRQRLRDGRDMLRRISGQDFGYELAAWHNHLKVSRQGGYTWNRNIALPRVMKAALASPEWQDAAAALQAKERRKTAERAMRRSH